LVFGIQINQKSKIKTVLCLNLLGSLGLILYLFPFYTSILFSAKMVEKSVVVAWMILEPSSPLLSVLPLCSLAWLSSSAFSVLLPLSFSSCAGTT
jgi:hypothetical protein